ncbi:branched-chain amino acid ABC transporter permease [Phytoactinopolyspora limicola]|uniref:branched-chain amino acid ABC transporter permease n=1 Tax=Phytoactinopolyspora limicola TaxID=2715536 RepID=UPI001407AC07|nr:branched-chain amino acid ABC transporter permease [Phytoactinopolyspora limicola]
MSLQVDGAARGGADVPSGGGGGGDGARRRPRSRVRGRPQLYTSYAADQAIWNTPAKRAWTLALVAAVLVLPFLLSRDLTSLLTTVFIFAIGGIGLNLITGYAGQVSLGHAFFMGLGAYTAAVFGGESTDRVVGLGLDMAIWLPLAGIVPAVVGLVVAPLAARVRGLYLAILTLGLVFIGEHVFKEARSITGGAGVGRAPAEPVLFGVDLSGRYHLFGYILSREDVFYFVCFAIFLVMAIAARNLTRSKLGRAFAAVRDRDVAAAVMGVSLRRTKTLAFTISSFYAGIAGALLVLVIGRVTPTSWNLFLSIDFLAVILIGGIATISGSILGAMFVVLMPRLVSELADVVPFISTSPGTGVFSVFQLQTMLFGALIVLFLVLEPRGLYGLWVRARNYWKAWPFSH